MGASCETMVWMRPLRRVNRRPTTTPRGIARTKFLKRTTAIEVYLQYSLPRSRVADLHGSTLIFGYSAHFSGNVPIRDTLGIVIMFINSILLSLERGAEGCLPETLRSRIRTIASLMPRMSPDQYEHAHSLILKLNRILEEQYGLVAPNVSSHSTIVRIPHSAHDFHPLTLVERVQTAA